MTFGSLFSGIGGLDKGLVDAGMRCEWQVEIDATCRSVLTNQFGRHDLKMGTDVRDVTTADFVRVDGICGGFPCFVGGTLVLCERGLVPIELVEVGDRVFSHDGTWNPVVRTMSRSASTVKLKGMGLPCLHTTPDHKIWACQRSREWTSRPSRGWNSSVGDCQWISALDMKGKHWSSPTAYPLTRAQEIEAIGRETNVPSLSQEFWWVVGKWIGDGWARTDHRRGRVTICASSSESSEMERRLREAGVSWCLDSGRTVDKYIISSRPLARWLLTHFGSKAHSKTIPSWALSMNDRDRRSLLAGYLFADGSTGQHVKFTTVSKSLAIGIRLLALTLGWNVSLYFDDRPEYCEIEGRSVRQRPTWQGVLRREKDRDSAIRRDWMSHGLVRSVEEGNEELVYDIEVESAHSFLADGVFVHNCQDLSVAGKRAGLAGERSGLFYEFMRVVRDFAPSWVLIENVPGLLSSWSGDSPSSLGIDPGPGRELDLVETSDFSTVLDALSELGYGAAYRVLDAQWFGVPQRRRRVFIVGCLGDWRRAAEVLFEPESLPWDSAPSRETGARVAQTIRPSTQGRGNASGGRNGGYPINLVNCLDSHMGTAGPDDNSAEANHLIAATLNSGGNNGGFRTELGEHLIAGSLQSHSKEHGHAMTTQQAAESGHLVAFGGNNTSGPIDVATACNAKSSASGRQDFESETFVAHILRAEGFDASEDGTGRRTPIIPILEVGARTNGDGDRDRDGIGEDGDPMYSLQASKQHGVAIPFDETQITHPENRSAPEPDSPSHTLPAQGRPPAIAYQCQGSNVGPMGHLRKGNGNETGGVPFVMEPLKPDGIMHDERTVQYADAEEENAAETLRILRSSVGEEAFEEWGIGVLASFWPKEILQSILHGKGIRRTRWDGRGLVDGTLSCTEKGSQGALRSLWRCGCEGRRPHRWKLPEQRARQLAAHLSKLPQQKTSKEKIMRCLWQASEGSGILRQALSTLQEMGRPDDGQAQSALRSPKNGGIGVSSAVRRLTPT